MTLDASEFETRLVGGLHACRDKLALVANAVVDALMGVVGTPFAHGATPVDIAWNDSLHTDIVSVESNTAVCGGNVRACRHGVRMDFHCKECSFAGFCGCRECGDDYA